MPWWVAVFLLALACRLGFLVLADGPLAFGHEQVYLTKGLWIAEHPDPVSFVLRSDAWRSWAGPYWTLPPLYQLFLAAFFEVVGPCLTPLLVLQCVMGAVTAVMVGRIGRELSPRRGAWAGAAYAVYWPAVVMPSNTMTENLHTALLVAALTAMAAGARRASRGLSALGGFVLGLSALARSVSSAFLPVAAVWHLRVWPSHDGRAAAALVLAAGAAAILPWTARNVFFMGDVSLIETVSAYNLWNDNAFVSEGRYGRQERIIQSQAAPGDRRAWALWFAWRGLTRHPAAVARKVWDNSRYFLRPDGLHALLVVEYPQPAWWHAGAIALGDAVLLLTVPLFLACALAGGPSPARSLLLVWTAYYLLMLLVVFHVELRYRSAWMPFALAGGAGGWAALRGEWGHRRRARAGACVGLALSALVAAPYAPAAWRGLHSAWALRPAKDALERGEVAKARSAAAAAAARDPAAARPWLTYGRLAARSGHVTEAIDAYRQARARRSGWIPALVLPALLRAAGRQGESAEALPQAQAASASLDPWRALEVAWRELPPPFTDEILLGRGDFGAVRGFLHARGDHRWSRGRAFLRAIPTRPSPAYDVTLEMGSPPPSPLPHPVVSVRVPGSPPQTFTLSPEVRPYTVRARLAPGEPLLVELEAPTWNRAGEAAEQGVRVRRMTVRAVGERP